MQEATAAIIEATGGGTSRVSCPFLSNRHSNSRVATRGYHGLEATATLRHASAGMLVAVASSTAQASALHHKYAWQRRLSDQTQF